jgi:hypothetical protein
MENSQATHLTNELPFPLELVAEEASDYLWKAFYSHSYTIIFKCENCDHEFDIDGWFFKFESLICPNCKTNYSGIFGKIIGSSKPDQNRLQRDTLKIETFEGQQMEIQLSNPRSFVAIKDHIILIVFNKTSEKQNKPWCAIDYSISNSKVNYLPVKMISTLSKNSKPAKQNSKVFLTFIVLGLISVFVLFIIFFPGFINH